MTKTNEFTKDELRLISVAVKGRLFLIEELEKPESKLQKLIPKYDKILEKLERMK
jgi:hypothetical protein